MTLSKSGSFNYNGNGKNERILFQYPSNIQWTCIRCGDCCKDLHHHTRRVLLTCQDLEIISKTTGLDDFYESTEEKTFEAVMKKKGGECVFLLDGSCSIYSSRALLCRMYPFWVERDEVGFLIKMDKLCRGIGKGNKLDEIFFINLLNDALHSMGY